jgi:hypothetical protein
MKLLALFFFTLVVSANSTPALACSPPHADFVGAAVTSSRPAKNVPNGAIQLKVDTSNLNKIIREYSDDGRITLLVKEVLNGQFAGSSIRLNATNVDDCNSNFMPMREYSYITVLPMKYPDGEQVLDRQDRQEFGPLFYKDTQFYEIENKQVPGFAEYSPIEGHQFSDRNSLICLDEKSRGQTNWSAEDWRKCVAPGRYVGLYCEKGKKGELVCNDDEEFDNRPLDLRRGYTFWGAYGAIIATIMLIFAALLEAMFFVKGTRRS